MDTIEPWGIWYSKTVAAGVRPELAELGRAVVREYWQHGRDFDDERDDGPYLGAHRHHEMMIALAAQKPDLAEAVFNAVLADGAPDEEKIQNALFEVEDRYADNSLGYRSPEWYLHVYSLEGCEWDLYTANDREALRP
jgi:hypothetical protein